MTYSFRLLILSLCFFLFSQHHLAYAIDASINASNEKKAILLCRNTRKVKSNFTDLDTYRSSIHTAIKKNWSFSDQNDIKLSATVNLTVKNDGTILKSIMTKNSGNNKFDQAVLDTINLINPLPPFPESLKKTQQIIEIEFSNEYLSQ